MRLVFRLLGRDLFEISTDADPEDKPAHPDDYDVTGGNFGFGRTDLTAIESPEQRWETTRVPPPSA